MDFALFEHADPVPLCDEPASTEVRGYALCEGCAEALGFLADLGARIEGERLRASEEPLPARRDSWGFALALAALSSLFALLAVCAGCSSTTERHEHLIRAGRILLRHSTPEAGWESRRETWLAASEIEAPDAAPVESGR